MEELDDDINGRQVFFSTDGETTDTYLVVDPNDSNYSFSLTFPFEEAQWYAYTIINQVPLRGVPNLCEFQMLNGFAGPWCSGRTVDRINLEAVLGMCYFDLDLRKPIWFVGDGTTGWVDASGAQV